MKQNLYDQKNLQEELLTETHIVNAAPEIDEKPPRETPQHALDDARRVKVLSPTQLVLKRFVRNKLAIVGLCILICMFIFSFLGVALTPYGEIEMFSTDEEILTDYASATYITTYTTNSPANPVSVDSLVNAQINSYIQQLVGSGETDMFITGYSVGYRLEERMPNKLYALQIQDTNVVGTFNSNNALSVTLTDNTLDNAEFKQLIDDNKAMLDVLFTYNGRTFFVKSTSLFIRQVVEVVGYTDVRIATNFTLNSHTSATASTAFMYELGTNLNVNPSFTFEGETYEIEVGDEILIKKGGVLVFESSNFVVRRASGEDSLAIDYKNAVKAAVDELIANVGKTESTFLFSTMIEVPIYEDVLDDEGNVIGQEIVGYDEVFEEDAEFTLLRENNQFRVRNMQMRRVFKIYSPPDAEHWLGTDGVGMDVLTRLMYGGRISLVIGFVVVIIEVLLGVIMGGLAGYFGKWVDGLIMRLVDVFNCLPFLPVLIILGAVFDRLNISPIIRIIWLMMLLGFMGWAGVARLVRGQILSLREQEYMIAAEATGLRAGRRIFRHLIPNVMPQLIVTATMGLGSVILLESTLSFLGLGAKFPMATWGSIINGVSSAFALANYVYIWLPAGLLICLTVVAFNFVGDGLRDALDPKMKR